MSPSPLLRRGHVAAIVVVVLLTVTAISVGLAFLLSGSDPTRQDLIYLPDDPAIFAYIDMKRFVASELYSELKKDMADLDESLRSEIGLLPADIITVTAAARSLTPGQEVSVVRTSRPVTVVELRASKSLAGSDSTKVGERTLHVGGKQAFCLIDSQTVLFGPAEELRTILQRGTPAKLQVELTDAMDEVGTGGTLTMAIDLGALMEAAGPAELKDPDDDPRIPVAPRVRRPAPPVLARELRGLEEFLGGGQHKAAALSIEADRTIKVRAVVLCKDAAAAESLRKLVDGWVVMERKTLENKAKGAGDKVPFKAVAEALDTLEVSASGARVTASIRGDAVEVVVKPVREARTASQRAVSASNLHQISIGIMNYAVDNRGYLPPDLAATWPYLADTSLFLSAAHDTRLPPVHDKMDAAARADWINRNSSYVYIGQGRLVRIQRLSETIIFFERFLSPAQKGVNVCFADRHVEWMDIEKANKQLKAQTGKSLEEWSRIEMPGAGAKELPKPGEAPR